jgi:hypothetical protein
MGSDIRRVYIAGPMTGVRLSNFPAFHAAAARLRAAGWEVVNPAELDGPDHEHRPLSRGEYMSLRRRDTREMLTCDSIYLLPGWQLSPGATDERKVAMMHDLEVFYPGDIP